MGKSQVATDEARMTIINSKIDIVLMQEQNYTKGRTNFKADGKIFEFLDNKDRRNRTAIWANKNICKNNSMVTIGEYTDHDITTTSLNINIDNKDTKILICSYYAPSLDQNKAKINNPINEKLGNLIKYCHTEKLGLIIGSDTNSHNKAWGEDYDDSRGNKFLDLIIKYQLNILNKGHIATFVQGKKSSIIDVTLSLNLSSKQLTRWITDTKYNGSDHRNITFNLETKSTPIGTIRYKKQTDWIKYKRGLQADIVETNWEIIDIKSLDTKAEKLTNILLNNYKNSSREKKIKVKNYINWYNNDLETQRKKIWRMQKDYYKATTTEKDKRLTEELKTAKNKYKKDCKKAKIKGYRDFTTNLETTKDIARIQKILENPKPPEITSILKEDGTYTKNITELGDELIKAHFKNCILIQQNQSNIHDNTTHNNTTHNKPPRDADSIKNIEELTSEQNVKNTIITFGSFKSPGEDEIFAALLQKGIELSQPILSNIFKESLIKSHIPKCWRTSKISFIPKAGKTSYTTPKSLRPISLMSVQLKLLEKMIDNKIRNEIELTKPINIDQHAYQKGKSTETALHDLITYIEKNLQNKTHTLAVFIDIEGAFDNTKYDIMIKELNNRGIEKWTIEWVQAMLHSRQIQANLDGSMNLYKATQGCPQGGCLSPLLWCLVVDPLIQELKTQGMKITAYADDMALLISGKKNFLKEMSHKMNKALKTTQEWCLRNGLNVNPEKSAIINFTTENFDNKNIQCQIFGKQIPIMKEFKYLGLTLDRKLSWKHHIANLEKKARHGIWTANKMAGKQWGLNPKNMLWLYKQIIMPRITYGCFCWWHLTLKQTNIEKLRKIQRQALMNITGCVSTTPTQALETITYTIPLHLSIRENAILSYIRLKNNKKWYNKTNFKPHHNLEELGKPFNNILETTCAPTNNNKPTNVKTIINEKNNWGHGINTNNMWFTDGAHNKNKGGIGITNNHGLEISLSTNHCNAFLTELAAINETIKLALIHQTHCTNGNLTIVTDSKQALRAINYPVIRTTILKQLTDNLKIASTMWTDITLAWCPGHNNITLNEKADKLAKSGISKPNIEVIIPFNKPLKCIIKEDIISKARKEWLENKHKFKLSNLNIWNYDKDKTKSLIKNNRQNTRIAIGLMTGHAITNKFLNRIHKANHTQCRFCHQKEETVNHWIWDCGEISDPDKAVPDKNNVSINKILKWAKAQGISKTFFEPLNRT